MTTKNKIEKIAILFFYWNQRNGFLWQAEIYYWCIHSFCTFLPQESHWGPWILCRLPLPVNDLFQKFEQLNHNRKYHNPTREKSSYFLFSWKSIAMAHSLITFSLSLSVERGKEQNSVWNWFGFWYLLLHLLIMWSELSSECLDMSVSIQVQWGLYW